MSNYQEFKRTKEQIEILFLERIILFSESKTDLMEKINTTSKGINDLVDYYKQLRCIETLGRGKGYKITKKGLNIYCFMRFSQMSKVFQTEKYD